MSVLKLRNIHKKFNHNHVLKGIDLDIDKGEVVTLIGSSGSGKSTLLRCINLLERPDDGVIFFNGKDIINADLNVDQFRANLGMVFQHFNLFENLTTIENCILAPIRVLGLSKADAEQRAMKHLENVGLSEFANAKVTSLSGGQKQRVAIARALCMNPKVLLFDEPTSALDPEVVGDVLDVIRNIADSGMTMVIVTHEMSFAKEVSDRVVYMKDGLIEYIADSETMFTNPQNVHAQNFLRRVL
ncbi:amino acid ABC transporter ATP-binding protein [Mollicutes bacterium LVI A0039]|nr:amino acid ABC transporter ATP-binding protein [Mollicutes bacterium LVI A0039]